tara:strand:- start:80 stop:811 length:732 start_codon:yes stop_codon:yes gene_type:complete
MNKLIVAGIITLFATSANAFDLGQTFDYSKSHKFTDSDWNATFVRGCGYLKPKPDFLTWHKEDGDKFARFTLNPSDKEGRCKVDNKKNRSRAEIKTTKRMKLGNSYSFQANVRFNEQVNGKVIFMQVHATRPGCKQKPPVKVVLNNSHRNIQIASLGTWEETFTRGMLDVGKWATVKIVLTNLGKNGTMDLYINDVHLIKDRKTSIQKSCAKPFGKIGLFALKKGENTVSADFDDVKMEQIKD